MAGLSAAKRKYIRAAYELSKEGEGASVSDIAERLGVARSSACLAVKALQKKKLVKRDKK